jgi:hypothetical protein
MAISGFNCSVDQVDAFTDNVNPGKSVITVVLTDSGGTFSQTRFNVIDGAKREILAIALAAVSNQYNVDVQVDVPTGVAPILCYRLAIIAG